MTIRNSKLTRVSGPEFVCHHTLYDTLDIPGVRVTCTVVNGRFINYIVRRVTCLLIYIDCFYFFSHTLCQRAEETYLEDVEGPSHIASR